MIANKFFWLPRSPVLSLPAQLLIVCLGVFILPGCASRDLRNVEEPIDFRDLASRVRAERVCRKIVVDMPGELSPAAVRQNYGHCLRTLKDDPGTGSESSTSKATDSTPAFQPPASELPDPTADPVPTAEQRYLFCRLHSDEIAAAALNYNQAVQAFGSAQALPPSSEVYQQAAARLTKALQTLEEQIPERFRNGRNLVPDVLRDFQVCQRPG